jgi:heme/copper-type cytochrome/quinol oxidase subunit 2
VNYILWAVAIYALLGVAAFVIVVYYVCQTRDRDEKSAGTFYKYKAITEWHWRVIVALGVFFYVVVLWLPLVLGLNVPPMPPINGSK